MSRISRRLDWPLSVDKQQRVGTSRHTNALAELASDDLGYLQYVLQWDIALYVVAAAIAAEQAKTS